MMKMRIVQACLLFTLLTLIWLPASTSHAENAQLSGDMTGDGQTTAADAAVMLRMLAAGRLNEADRPDLDFTKNGDIDATDARAALLYACGGIDNWVSFGERVSGGLCDESLFDHFSYTGTKVSESGAYQSDTVSVRFLSGSADKSNYHLADIYIQDLSCFVTAFGAEKFRGSRRGAVLPG